ncbi:MAG: hypothetical protein AAGB93_15400 [Planctomycetota bacterium]
MTNARPERRGSPLAQIAWTLVVAAGAAGCVSETYSMYERNQKSAPKTADLAYEISVLVDDLSERAGLRIPLGSARVIIDEPVPIRPKSARFRPAAQGERDRRATQAAVRFELEMALGNRMNVVGAGDLASGALESPATEVAGRPEQSLAQRAERTGATHALLGSFVRDGDDLDLSVRLIELDSEWIVATARRRITNYVPDAYDERYGTPVPVAPVNDMKRTAEIVPPTETVDAADGNRRGADPAAGSTGAAPAADGATAPATSSQPSSGVVPDSSGAPSTPAGAAGQPMTSAAGETPAGGATKTPTSSRSAVPPAADPTRAGEANGLPESGPIEFDVGPAAARLRGARRKAPTKPAPKPKEQKPH